MPLTKHSTEERVYDLRNNVKNCVMPRIEINHNEDSLFMASRMTYCCI